MEVVPPDAGIDAGPDATPQPDAGPPAALSSKIFVLATGSDSLMVFDAETFASLGTATLPVKSASQLAVAEDILWVLGGTTIGQASDDQHLTALDPKTTLLKAGYPKTMHGAECGASSGLVTKSGLYCVSNGASTEADDVLHLMAPPDFAISKSSPNTPSPLAMGGSDGLVLVSYGGTVDKTVAIFNEQLAALTGSPITSPTTFAVSQFAASRALNRVAIASLTQVALFDTSTMQQVGSAASYSSTNVAGMVFDDANQQLVITSTAGGVTGRSTMDFSEKSPLTMRGGSGMRRPFVDPTRGRVYLVDASLPKPHLVVLDAATLSPVAGSPVELTNGAQDVVAY